ncbi:putative glycosyltransferase [Pseudohyphozyma bogoriensis]|nr:putative glycosyltransferase [Pseudohyphozyma bogoriensis]
MLPRKLFNSSTPVTEVSPPLRLNQARFNDGDFASDDDEELDLDANSSSKESRQWGSTSKARAYSSSPRSRPFTLQPYFVALVAVTLGVTALLTYKRRTRDPASRFDIPHEPEYAQRTANWSWGHHEPHVTLTKMLDDLHEDDKATWDWLVQAREISNRGTPIGLSASDPPEPIRERRASGGRGPGQYREGSPEKYGKLASEWRTGQKVTACSTKDWAHRYAEKHQGVVNGTIKPELVEFVCRRNGECGGVADRLLGTVSSFALSLLTDRAFFVSWEFPVPFDLVFDSPHIDWSTPYHVEESNNVNPFYKDQHLANGPWVANTYNQFIPEIDKTHQDLFENKWWNHPWVEYAGNRGMVLRMFRQAYSARSLYLLGLNPDSAYSCLTDYLIRPKLDVNNFISQYTSFFQLPSIYTISIQIRTGDASMHKADVELENTVEKYQHYFRCADQIASTRARRDQKVVYYLLSDSEHLKADALARYPDKVVVSGLGASHPLEDDGTQKEAFTTADGMQDAIAESWIQESADFMIITMRSGFGKIQSFRRGQDGTTISLPRNGLWSGNDDMHVTDLSTLDCSVPEMYTTWTHLAGVWSYG